MSNPIRLEILVLLRTEDRRVSGLVTEFEAYSPQAISHHLSFLRVAGLVEYRTVGPARIYRLTGFGGGVVRAVGGLIGDFEIGESPGP